MKAIGFIPGTYRMIEPQTGKEISVAELLGRYNALLVEIAACQQAQAAAERERDQLRGWLDRLQADYEKAAQHATGAMQIAGLAIQLDGVAERARAEKAEAELERERDMASHVMDVMITNHNEAVRQWDADRARADRYRNRARALRRQARKWRDEVRKCTDYFTDALIRRTEYVDAADARAAALQAAVDGLRGALAYLADRADAYAVDAPGECADCDLLRELRDGAQAALAAASAPAGSGAAGGGGT